MTRCESYPLCSGTIYFPTAPDLHGVRSSLVLDRRKETAALKIKAAAS